jgi:hypothetical protein
MARGEKRGNREAKKPKQEKKVAPAASPFVVTQGKTAPGARLPGRKK